MTLPGLLMRSDQQKALDGIYFDDLNGFAGTDYPFGTPAYPSNNLADALVIMAARNTNKLYLVGTGGHNITFDVNVDIELVSNEDYTITIGPLITANFFGDLKCSAIFNTTGSVTVYGNFESYDNINQTDAGTFDVTGNAKIGNTIINTTGIITIYGNCQILNGISQTDAGVINIVGNCQIAHGHLLNSNGGNVTIYGKLDINGPPDVAEGYLDNTGGLMVFVGNDCHTSSYLINTTGLITIWGNTYLGYEPGSGVSLSTTEGVIAIFGNLEASGLITLTDTLGTGSINIAGDVFNLGTAAGIVSDALGTSILIRGNLEGESIETVNSGGVLVEGYVQIEELIENNSTTMVEILGNCQIAHGHLLNSNGGNVTIYGKLDINGDPGASEGYLDNTGGATVFVSNDLHISYYMRNTTGTIYIYGNAHIFGNTGIAAGVGTTTGTISIAGDLRLANGTLEVTDAGSVLVYGNCSIFENLDAIDNQGSGTITICKDLFVAGDLTNDDGGGGGTIIVYGIGTVKGDITNTGTLEWESAPFTWSGDMPIDIDAIVASETDVFYLTGTNVHFEVRKLRLKCADPGANTVNVKLYERVNDALTAVDSFAITAANFATYHSLVDMFGVPHLSGCEIEVTVQASAGGPYAITGQYTHGKTRVASENGSGGGGGCVC